MRIEIKQGELWYTAFPFDDDSSRSKDRPAIVLHTEPLCILSTKVTTHIKRGNDLYDIDIVDWKQAGLKYPSVARVAKTISLSVDRFIDKIGELSSNDFKRVMSAYIQYRISKGDIPLENAEDLKSEDLGDDEDYEDEDITNSESSEDTNTSSTNYFESDDLKDS